MIPRSIYYICFGGTLFLGAAYAEPNNDEEAVIRNIIEQRRVAWNTQDTRRYAALLAPDADSVSSTGRSAEGREETINLYVEQRRAAYQVATMTSTVVKRVKFVRPDVALADAETEIEGVRGPDGEQVAPRRSLVYFILILS